MLIFLNQLQTKEMHIVNYQSIYIADQNNLFYKADILNRQIVLVSDMIQQTFADWNYVIIFYQNGKAKKDKSLQDSSNLTKSDKKNKQNNIPQ